jgi:hypothetical protein
MRKIGIIILVLVSVVLLSGCITQNAIVTGTISSVSFSNGNIRIRFTSGSSAIFEGDQSTYKIIKNYIGKSVEVSIKDAKLISIIVLEEDS